MENSNEKFNQLFELICIAPSKKEEDLQDLVGEFYEILHSGDDFYKKVSGYQDKLGELVFDCINENATDLVQLILATNPTLRGEMGSALSAAASMGRIQIYEAIEEKILSNPQLYLASYERLKKGLDLEEYLTTAISLKEVDFIKMLLEKYPDFYKTSPLIEKLFHSEELLGQEVYSHIHKKLIELNYSESNLTAEIKKPSLDEFQVLLSPGSRYIESLRNEQLSAEIINETLNELGDNWDDERYHIALETASLLNNDSYSKEYKSKVFEMTFATLFKDMPINAKTKGSEKDFDLIHSACLTYLVNNWQVHEAYIENLSSAYFFPLRECVLNESAINTMKLRNFFNNTDAAKVFGIGLYKSLSYIIETSIMKEITNGKKPLSNEAFTIAFPQIYEKYLEKVHQMLFIAQSKEKTKEMHKEKIDPQSFMTIYNNQGYLNSKPTGDNFKEGKQLFLDPKKKTPIGYNIHLPENKVEGIVVQVYGGHKKEPEKNAYKPDNLTDFDKYLINRGIAVITLNLPDLLKLEKYQGEMPESLYTEIQDCISKFYQTLKHNPTSLHSKLSEIDMESIKIMLYGASFGATVAIGQAQKNNDADSYDGYISHDGAINNEINYKSDLPIASLTGRKFNDYIGTVKEEDLKKINKPVLLAHNKNDNNVNVLNTTRTYDLMVKYGKSENTRLLLTEIGNPTPSDGKELHNKGHGIPTNKNEFIIYAETILNFIKNGPSPLPEVTEFEGFRADKLANKFYRSGTLEQKFVSEALELFEKKYLSYERLTPKLVTHSDIQKHTSDHWESTYQSLFYAMYQANHLAYEDTNRQLLKNEIDRFKNNNLLTNEVILNTINSQSNIFLQFIEEIHGIKLPMQVDFSKLIIENPKIVTAFKESFNNLSNKDDAYIHHFLSSLYKANPSLLDPLHPSFENNPKLKNDLNSAKSELQNTLNKGQSMLLHAYQAHKNNSSDSIPIPSEELKIPKKNPFK